MEIVNPPTHGTRDLRNPHPVLQMRGTSEGKMQSEPHDASDPNARFYSYFQMLDFIPISFTKKCKKRQMKCGGATTCTQSWGGLKRHKHKLLSESDSDAANKITFPLSSLPEHILLKILTFLPAHVLHNVAMYVCRSWYRLVKDPIFIRDNFLRSSCFPSFNTHAWCQIPSQLHLQIGRNHSLGSKLQITSSALPLCCQVMATCNGLLLARKSSNSKFTLYLLNPVTGEYISDFVPLLPPMLSSPDELPIIRSVCYPKPAIGIAYVPFLETYKVVLFPPFLPKNPVLVLTLGKDTAWRFVDTTHAKIKGLLHLLVRYMDLPISIDGYIYWTNSCRPEFVLVFEAESEKLYHIPSPAKTMVSSFLMSNHDNNGWLGVADFEGLSNVQIWALTNLELREWTKMFTIETQIDTCFQGFRGAFDDYDPDHQRKAQLIHCSTSGEVMLVYFSKTSMVLYWGDVRTGAYEAIIHDKPTDELYFYTRVETLISPKSIATTTH